MASGRPYPRSAISSACENLPPKTLARVSREIRDLHKGPPEGVRLVVDADTGVPSNLGEVLAEIEGPTGTPYEGKFFQLKLLLSPDFPASPPRGFFMTKIYHPNVDMSTGAICVNTLKKDWTAETTFAHVLSVIRCLLIIPFPESSLNDEAGKLFMESYDEYAKRARLMAGVHGRSQSCEEDVKSEENADAKKKSPYRSKSVVEPRSKSLRDMNRSTASGGSSNAMKVGNGTKSKKKSLKRL
jgi:ubiquitin-conjugating enzyme E2 S